MDLSALFNSCGTHVLGRTFSLSKRIMSTSRPLLWTTRETQCCQRGEPTYGIWGRGGGGRRGWERNEEGGNA